MTFILNHSYYIIMCVYTEICDTRKSFLGKVNFERSRSRLTPYDVTLVMI